MIKEFDNKTSKDIPIPIKAGIIEYEFVTIHPFGMAMVEHLDYLLIIY